MCFSAEALALFLNIIGADLVSTQIDRVIVHSQTRDAHYVQVGEEWCTMAPQIDRMVRFALTKGDT